jgi:hypothetical protein
MKQKYPTNEILSPLTPHPTLFQGGGNIVSTNELGNNTPNNPSNWASEEQMINRFILFTEITPGISYPSSSDHIILCENGVIRHQPHKDLNLW